jgi:hypothetical protein
LRKRSAPKKRHAQPSIAVREAPEKSPRRLARLASSGLPMVEIRASFLFWIVFAMATPTWKDAQTIPVAIVILWHSVRFWFLIL